MKIQGLRLYRDYCRDLEPNGYQTTANWQQELLANSGSEHDEMWLEGVSRWLGS